MPCGVTCWGYVPQDDYDTWPGEANLVNNGTGPAPYNQQGWIAYNRHRGGANYLFYDGHAKWMRWSQARLYQYPDHNPDIYNTPPGPIALPSP